MLSKDDINISVKYLTELLASTYILAAKTQNFHWNVKDARFSMLHDFFGNNYNQLIEGIDEIAERIRMLEKPVNASLASYLDSSSIKEAHNISDGTVMLKELTYDHQTIISLIRNFIEKISLTKDQGTLDFLINRLQYHEKMTWIMQSHIC